MALLIIAVLLATRGDGSTELRDEVIGSVGVHVVAPGESLIEIARQCDLGFNEIAAANPQLDAFVPEVGATVTIPTAWIIPAAAVQGTLVVNLSEMRLYVFPVASAPITFPVGVAVEPNATPVGLLKVVGKAVDPTWHPTPRVRREDPTLPAAVPPGPDNPLGSHALRLSNPTILIHGTNKPFGVGRKVSHGCVRLYPEDIRRLFGLVAVGTRVAIVRETVKVGVRQGRIFVEVHDDEAVRRDALDEARRLLRHRALLDSVDEGKLVGAVRARNGVPVDVTADQN
jgi:L,D-transpeptidase ErfK/SrfK